LKIANPNLQESAMQIITFGKRLVPAEQIALVEPFDPSSNSEFRPERTFSARVVLLNRDTILTEASVQAFAEENGFYLLGDEKIAVNATMAFAIETFTPSESFKPEKAYKSRIKWRDRDGNDQSKLLLMEPETVVLELSRRGGKASEEPMPLPQRPTRRRRTRAAEADAK
jgi:hypothetical protein